MTASPAAELHTMRTTCAAHVLHSNDDCLWIMLEQACELFTYACIAVHCLDQLGSPAAYQQ